MDENKEQGEKLLKRTKHIQEAREKFGIEAGEDTTKYGEFVCSYFAWISPEEQKEKANRLQNLTINKK